MAINFVRIEYKSRLCRRTGKKTNAVLHSAYVSRQRLFFEGTQFETPRFFNFGREGTIFSTVLLPEGVDPKFSDKQYLWNQVELAEKRKDSQLYFDCVLALPDDACVTDEMRKEIAIEFSHTMFVSKGLAVQLDIHEPQQNDVIDQETGEVIEKAHNHHAHLSVTTRTFTEDGKAFHPIKPRDVVPQIVRGVVVGKQDCPQIYTAIQNRIFEKYGLDLRVDHKGVVNQVHLGPLRLRSRALNMLLDNDQRIEQNKSECKDPEKILHILTEHQSTFSRQDLHKFLETHVEQEDRTKVESAFWSQPTIVQLREKRTLKSLQLFTSKEVTEEEDKIFRIASRLNERPAFSLSKNSAPFTKELNHEQKLVFDAIVSSDKAKALTLLEGHAGTGKSYLLSALREKFTSEGYTVRAFGPDNATVKVLKEKGFENATTLHHTLYSAFFTKLNIATGRELWLLDEAGKLGNGALLEMLKVAEKNKVQVVICGNSAQLPSVSRGGMLKVLCDHFGHQKLEDIQRQKSTEQRDMAKRLAFGDFSGAFDQISRTGGFKWFASQGEALEACAKAWASHKLTSYGETCLIIAHSNAEVRAMNELVRQVRRELKEIDSREFLCETTFGNLFISRGDEIEFRKKDKELGVENGTRGVIIDASTDRFVVAVNEGKKKREVSFNPQQYRSFQLGYALTYNRSQGQTVDKALIVASPMMNKEMFYVGLTRHVHDVTCFVSSETAFSLSDLKRKALQSGYKPTTYDYTFEARIHEEKVKQDKENKIDALRSSKSILDKAQGHLLGIGSKISTAIEKRADRTADASFYSYIPEKEASRGKVELVTASAEISPQILETTKGVIAAQSTATRVTNERKPFHLLSEANQKTLSQYFDKSDESSMLYRLVLSEAESNNLPKEKADHYPSWQKACAERNELAHQIVSRLKGNDLSEVMSEKALHILVDRSRKHETTQKPIETINDQLKEHLEELVYRLFPDGPSRRDSRGLRFGKNGSLSVTMTGTEAGTFYDFSEAKGGGPLQLIQKSENLNPTEAREWAKKFIGDVANIAVPDYYRARTFQAYKETNWLSLKPPKGSDFPGLGILSPYLDKNFQLSTVHTYRDAEGDPLFYVARLINKKTGKKLPLPVSYGKDVDQGSEKWACKGYTSESRLPLYNLHLLRKDPLKPVLLVEGEKTADSAIAMVGERYNVLTWSGGASGTRKSDWSPLFAKEICIWPDNDKAGFEAARTIEDQLKSQGVKSLRIVDTEMLAKELPPKWDLADPLPEGKNRNFINDMLLRAEQRAVSITQLLPLIGKSIPEERKPELLLLFNEVLYRVDRRIREDKAFANVTPKELNDKITKETSLLLKPYLNKTMSPIETQCLLAEARIGKESPPEQVKEIQQALNTVQGFGLHKQGSYSFHRTVAFLIESGIKEENVLKRRVENNYLHEQIADRALETEIQRQIRVKEVEL